MSRGKLKTTAVLFLFVLVCFVGVWFIKRNLTPYNPIQDTCREEGGKWEIMGLRRQKVCNFKTTDVGKVCTDSKQCQGACVANDPAATSGKCTEWTSNTGCHVFINNGKSSGLLCVD